jgi:hypothetical protein
MNERPISSFQESSIRNDASRKSSSGPRLCVTVIATTPDGTTTALDAARSLAKDLDAKIALLATEVVPMRFPLDKPPVSLEFTMKQQCSLVLRSSAREEDVTVRLCLCRDRDTCLRLALRRRALVVIGGRRHWWLSSEERLEKALQRQGHHVIFVDVDRKTHRAASNGPLNLRSGTGRSPRQTGFADSFFGGEGLR